MFATATLALRCCVQLLLLIVIRCRCIQRRSSAISVVICADLCLFSRDSHSRSRRCDAARRVAWRLLAVFFLFSRLRVMRGVFGVFRAAQQKNQALYGPFFAGKA